LKNLFRVGRAAQQRNEVSEQPTVVLSKQPREPIATLLIAQLRVATAFQHERFRKILLDRRPKYVLAPLLGARTGDSVREKQQVAAVFCTSAADLTFETAVN
jgi:hypothetical protein